MPDRVGEGMRLSERLEIIENLPITLDEKIYMSLVCMDLIPAWEISSKSAETERNVDELNTLLIGAGFETKLIQDEQNPGAYREICYSNSIEEVQKLSELASVNQSQIQSPETAIQFGRLYGFPETAIQAYTYNRGDTIGRRDLPSDIQDEDYMVLAQFAFSKGNWPQELEIIKKQAKALELNVPNLWREYVAKIKTDRAENSGDFPVPI